MTTYFFRMQHVGAQFNCTVLGEADYGNALADDRINVVVVCTTSSSHHKLIIQACTTTCVLVLFVPLHLWCFAGSLLMRCAVKKGKHVFCEKPVALSLKDTMQCVELAKTMNLVLYCGMSGLDLSLKRRMCTHCSQGFQRRSDTHFMRTKELLGAHTIQQIRVTSREPGGHNDMAYLLSSGGTQGE
jgi:hypothetical protein